MNLNAAIFGYGAYVPIYRIRTEEIARVWHGGGAGPNRMKAIASYDEDILTMSYESAFQALGMANYPKIQAILVGSESKPYAVKPTGSILSDILGYNSILGVDLEFACKAGTEAIQLISGMVSAGTIDYGLAIGADTAQGRPADELEFTAGSGAGAVVLGKPNGKEVAKIKHSVSYVTDTPDFWRRPHDQYPMHLGRFTGEPAYFTHTTSSVKMLFSETGMNPSDFKYAIFHQPNPRFPVEVGKRLGFTDEQLRPALLNDDIGNTYSANTLIALAKVLDMAKTGDMIMLASFGSGAGSDAFVIEVNSRGDDDGYVPFSERLRNYREVDYATYARWRGKIQK
ncbi:MAG: hydroxymethylglutaryl-CoA synthase [Conexivisphaerales archaeon]